MHELTRTAGIPRRQTEASAARVNGAVARMAPKLDLCCDLCGYGIVSRLAPARCPMCGGAPEWAEPLGWASRRAALQRRLAG